jgi:hypothetical protein
MSIQIYDFLDESILLDQDSQETWEQLGNNCAQTREKRGSRADQKAGRINKMDVPALSAKPPSPVQSGRPSNPKLLKLHYLQSASFY